MKWNEKCKSTEADERNKTRVDVQCVTFVTTSERNAFNMYIVHMNEVNFGYFWQINSNLFIILTSNMKRITLKAFYASAVQFIIHLEDEILLYLFCHGAKPSLPAPGSTVSLAFPRASSNRSVEKNIIKNK